MAQEIYKNKLLNDANLVSYWRFEDNVLDSKGSNNGTASNISYSAAKFGKGVTGNGSSGYVNIGTAAAFNITTGDATWSFWINCSSFSNSPVPFFKGTFQTNGYYCQIDNNGIVTFRSNQSGASQAVSTTGNPLSLNKYTLVTITKTGTTVDIYFNAIKIATGSITNPTTSANNFVIGNYDLGILTFSPNGTMDDFSFFSRALSQAEITDYFNAGSSNFIPFFM